MQAAWWRTEDGHAGVGYRVCLVVMEAVVPSGEGLGARLLSHRLRGQGLRARGAWV